MADDQTLVSDVKYKQFVAAIDKCLKNFEYSSEWADLISCLGRLNKIIQTYSQYSAVPRKLLIGKRLAQCLHPALPSGVHLKALESYHLIFTQIGSARLAQDLFIYTSGLFPLLSQASMSVKPLLLDLYENHLLPLRKKLYPGLSGLLLALLPGIEEVSEYTIRTTDILLKLCANTETAIFYSCLWDCVLHSAQVRLPAMTFVLTYLNKNKSFNKFEIMGSDTNLMVNALCGSLDDTNVLVQRITLDFAISFVSFHNTTLPKQYLVKLLTYALGVFLRRDMSLNRRIFQWLLNVNGEGNPINDIDNLSSDEQTEDEKNPVNCYFDHFSKEILVAGVVKLFRNVIKYHQDYVETKATNMRKKSMHLKPFRILITLLDRPEVGSAILENVMLEVLRMLYQHYLLKEKYSKNEHKHTKIVQIMHDELIKNANLLFNSFESFFMWDYLGRMFQTCSTNGENEIENSTNEELIVREKPTYCELFLLTSYLLDVVSLETSLETQSVHWPALLKLIIREMVTNVENLTMETIHHGLSLLSKLLSKLSPNFQAMITDTPSDITSTVLQTTKSPPMSPTARHDLEFFSHETMKPYNDSPVIVDCINLSKLLFDKFIKKRILKSNNSGEKMLSFTTNQVIPVYDNVSRYDKYNRNITAEDTDDHIVLAEGFQIFCRYLVELSCFPVNFSQQQQLMDNAPSEYLEDWLQLLICCCCNEQSFNIQGAALTCFLDLINVVLAVQQSSVSNNTSLASIVPLILHENQLWIERSNLYEVLAQSLWQRITPNACQYHQTAVDLLLRLHNITPAASVCENVISKTLVHHIMDIQELSHWRFGVLWHLSRDFYRDDNNKANKGVRTLDKCLLLMMDSLQSHQTKIRDYSQEWLRHCINFGDIGRVIEPLLLVLLHPTSSRIAVHYKWKFNKNSNLKNILTNGESERSLIIQKEEASKESEGVSIGSKDESKEAKEGESSKELSRGELSSGGGFADDEEDDEVVSIDQQTLPGNRQRKEHNKKSLPTHPLLVHKLYYTQHYDNQQCLYSLRRLLLILNTEGRSFICSAATNSMSVCNTPHQSLLRELLIRHRKVLSGNEFYGTLVEAHQLLIRASTAKYLEILLSVCLYFIRSEYLESLNVNESELEDNFAVQTASADVLTKMTDLLLEIANESGKGFSSYINDLLFRSKIQRIALHCLLSTVYAVTGDYKESTETGFYSMVDSTNLTQTNPRQKIYKNQLCLRKSILKFVQSLIYLEHCIGTENVTAHVNEKTKSNKEKYKSTSKVGPFEYIAYKPIVSQPMFISATLTVLREKQWIYLHNDWISLLISCLRKYNEDMKIIIVPVVEQICDNIKLVTRLFEQSYSSDNEISEIELPPDYMLMLLSNLTSFCQYCLINTTLTTMSMMPSRLTKKDETSTSMFSNIVNAFSTNPQNPDKGAFNETESSDSLAGTRDGLLNSLPAVLTAVLTVWNAWDTNKISSKKKNITPLVKHLPLPIGDPKSVRIAILQLVTPIAMNHTVVFLSSIADVWCTFRDLCHTKTNSTVGKEWISSSNKKFLPDVTENQQVLLEIVQAIKALSVQNIIDTSKQVMKQLVNGKERSHPLPLDICLLQFLHELLTRNTADSIIQIKSSLLALLKECLQLNITPPSMFVLFSIFNIFVHRVPVPEERRARRELQELAQKFLENFNTIAAASLESSAWFRRSLQVVTQLDQSTDLEESTYSDKSSAVESVTPTSVSTTTMTGGAKSSTYSISAVLIMAEYLTPMLDMLYLSEEKDKIASSLVYLMYNIVPYLKNHSHQNIAGYRACSALLAAISDYQYTLRAWKKDGYELFLDTEYFNMDKLSFSFWKTITDRLITYDPTIFKDLMQKIALSQSGAINIFANREQEMEQRALLLKRLSFIISCGEFDQYHQSLPDIQERLAESIRQLQGPFLHEQVFLCFRVLITRMSPNHLVSLWPPILTELVLVFVHMEHELSSANKPKNRSRLGSLDSFLGTNGYIKDPSKWLRLYLAVCKLLDFLLILPSDVLPHYQVYKWAFSETPGIFCLTNFDEIENSVCVNEPVNTKEKNLKDHKNRIRNEGGKKGGEVSKMAILNAPIAQQQKQAMKDKQKIRHKQSSKQDNLKSFFLPYVSRILKILRQQNVSSDVWQSTVRVPGELILRQTKISSIYDLIPFFLAVSGNLAAQDVDVTKFIRYKQKHVEDLIEKDFLEYSVS